MTTVEALKRLYVAMGGDAEDVADITLTAAMISAIADLVTEQQESEPGEPGENEPVEDETT